LGFKWEEVTGVWRKLHTEELHDVYSIPDIIGKIIGDGEIGGAYGTMREKKNVSRILVGKPEIKSLLGRHNH
jgi:hypothetical protein